MNVLIVYAHPEPQSLNGSLLGFAVARLESQGHSVQVSDLYAMKWKSQVDREDFQLDYQGNPLSAVLHSKEAFKQNKLTDDVVAEHRKLEWADAVVFQFPFWWFSMPAILKGWVDRVYAYGFGYGVGEHSDKKWGDRYGDGVLKGKRAFLVVTCGGWEDHFSERGINGPIDDLLFPINHGILFYPGFDVLRPFVVYKTMLNFDAPKFAKITSELGLKLDNMFTETPIPYRRQNGGDYEIPSLRLKEGISGEKHGFRIHEAD